MQKKGNHILAINQMTKKVKKKMNQRRKVTVIAKSRRLAQIEKMTKKLPQKRIRN